MCTVCPMEEKLRKTPMIHGDALAHTLSAVAVLGIYPQPRGTWGTGQPSYFRSGSEHRSRRESQESDDHVVAQRPSHLPYPFCSRSQHFTTSGSKRIMWRNLIVGMPAYRKLRIWRTLHPTYRATSSAVQRESDGDCAVVANCGAAAPWWEGENGRENR